MYRLVVMLGVLAAALLIANGLQGQDKKEPAPFKGVLPPNFGKIGITEEQKQKIYKIGNETREKVAELEKKIAELREKGKQEVLNLLTEEQKKKLKEILAEQSRK